MYKISKLSNGIRVITENIDYVKSVSIGVWIGAGSAMERLENNGVSHFIEHMLFKGTKTRSAKDIAEYMDRVGGQLNAMTAKEYTCYYAKTLTEHSEMSIEILSDMLINSTFSSDNIETERKVISEEIDMCEDTPEDAIHDYLSALMWRDNPLGFPIAGSDESLEKIDRDVIIKYHDSHYRGNNMVISVVGNFDEQEIIAKLEAKFGGIKPNLESNTIQNKLDVVRGERIITRDIEQCHVCIGFEGLPRWDERFYDLLVVNAILGGNMSSRLFQKVREEKGLAYSIYSYVNSYKNNGSLVIYAGLNTENVVGAMNIINNELKRLTKEKLTKDEIEVVKQQMKSIVIMGLEGMSSRMSSYGKSILFDNKIKDLDEIIRLIDKVNEITVAETIDQTFVSAKANITAMGRVNDQSDILKAIDF